MYHNPIPDRKTTDKLEIKIKTAVPKSGWFTTKDMGKIMSELKKTHTDEIDFSKAGPMIKDLLNK